MALLCGRLHRLAPQLAALTPAIIQSSYPCQPACSARRPSSVQAAAVATEAPASAAAAAPTEALQPFHLAIPIASLDVSREFYGGCGSWHKTVQARAVESVCSRHLCCRVLGCMEGRRADTWQVRSFQADAPAGSMCRIVTLDMRRIIPCSATSSCCTVWQATMHQQATTLWTATQVRLLLHAACYCLPLRTTALTPLLRAVPVPHFGMALTVKQFEDFAQRLQSHGVKFEIEPHLRFRGVQLCCCHVQALCILLIVDMQQSGAYWLCAGKPGEQLTMFFKVPAFVCCRPACVCV